MPQTIAPTGKTRIACVWGHPVAHSRSPRMQNAALAALGLDWAYLAFNVAPEALGAAVQGLRAMNFIGTNCTVPLKEQVGQYLDALDPAAERIGSVNTIVNQGGYLTGYSTDGPGLAWDLERQNMLPGQGGRVLVWGAGGSSRAIAAELAGRGLQITIANRTVARAEDVAAIAGRGALAVGLEGHAYEQAIAEADLLINATTLGMDNAAMPPLPVGLPNGAQAIYDIVYSPPETPLLARARAAGCRAVSNGAGMLACQGALALSLWSGISIERLPLEVMLEAAAGS